MRGDTLKIATQHGDTSVQRVAICRLKPVISHSSRMYLRCSHPHLVRYWFPFLPPSVMYHRGVAWYFSVQWDIPSLYQSLQRHPQNDSCLQRIHNFLSYFSPVRLGRRIDRDNDHCRIFFRHSAFPTPQKLQGKPRPGATVSRATGSAATGPNLTAVPDPTKEPAVWPNPARGRDPIEEPAPT